MRLKYTNGLTPFYSSLFNSHKLLILRNVRKKTTLNHSHIIDCSDHKNAFKVTTGKPVSLNAPENVSVPQLRLQCHYCSRLQ